MGKNLVIVESPAKCKTLKKYLGKEFEVLASYGHVRDLVPKEGAVDPDADFAMRYEVIERNERHVNAIAKAARKAEALYLATDPDREGEAISWHLHQLLEERGVLAGKSVQRVVFHEITKRAIDEAMAHPRDLSQELVDAQQARRALDYLVGFNLSPLLWKKIRRGLSAGRVQSPALRMIVEREEEIEAFVAREYWTLDADLDKAGQAFSARLTHLDGRKLDQFDLNDEAGAQRATGAVAAAAQGQLTVEKVERKQRKRHPAPPFITSTLQQEAARKLRFTTQRTMRTAQQLYEGIDIGHGEQVGLITYMRTDSVNLAAEALDELRALIAERYGADQLPAAPRQFKTKSKNAQEAHEAIRPTLAAHTPEALKGHLSADQFKLYDLVWKRAVASQMNHATINTVAIDLTAGAGDRFRATGSTVVDPGFMAVYREDVDDRKEGGDDDEAKLLPPVAEGEALELKGLRPEQHFTEPPPRFSEPGQGAGGTRHRPAVDLRLDHQDPAGPRVRPARQAPLHPDRCRPRGQPLPDPPLHPLRRLRLHRPPRGRARRGGARRGGLAAAAARVLGPVPRPDRGEGAQRHPRRGDQRTARRGVPEVRPPAGHQAGQARPLRRLHRLFRCPEQMRLHPRSG